MKYFLLSGDSNPNAIGVNNGVYQGKIVWKKFENKKNGKKISEYFSLNKHIENKGIVEPINFEIEYIEALKSAKMTDFFKYSPKLWGINFFVTEKVIELLSEFKLPPSIFVPANIYHQSLKYKYYGMYLPTHYREDSLDFTKSVFYEGIPSIHSPKKYVEINSINDYRNHKGLITPKKLKYNKKFDSSLDLFDTIWAGIGYYISENLKQAIEDAGLTGIEISESKEPELVFD